MGSADVAGAIERIKTEATVSRLLHSACVELVDLLDGSRSAISRVIGDLIVELSAYECDGDERPLELFLLSDYPLTLEVIATGKPLIVLRKDPNADPAETALMERLGFDSLLMAPLRSRGKNWGLVEIYGGGRGFEPAEIEVAFALVEGVGELLARLESTA